MNIRNLIRRFITTGPQKDETTYPSAQGEVFGELRNSSIVIPYGLLSSVPPGGDGIVLQLMGQGENLVAIVSDSANRKKGLKPGECGLENTITKTFVLMKEDGSLEINAQNNVDITTTADVNVTSTGDTNITVAGTTNVTSTGDVNMTAPNLNLTGNLNVIGFGTFTGPVTALDFITASVPSYNAHLHTGVTVGVANSGGPI